MDINLTYGENLNIQRNDSTFQIFKTGFNVGGKDITILLQPWQHYVFEEVTQLTITLNATEENAINIFSFEFDSGVTPTVFELDIDEPIGYINGSPTIEANSHYYFYVEKSYDGRYFCKWEKYIGGGSYIYPPKRNNVIKYKANSKLAETTSSKNQGLHVNSFIDRNGNILSIVSHTFNNSTNIGTIEFSDDIELIDNYAFYNAGIIEITLPSTIRGVSPNASDYGSGAFAWCLTLNKITIYATSAPYISTKTFEGVASGGTLYTPANSDYSNWLSKLSGWINLH